MRSSILSLKWCILLLNFLGFGDTNTVLNNQPWETTRKIVIIDRIFPTEHISSEILELPMDCIPSEMFGLLTEFTNEQFFRRKA